METQKIVNLLNGSDDENSEPKLQQNNFMLLTVSQKVIIQKMTHKNL